MEFVIRAILTTAVAFGLLKLFFDAQELTESRGKPRVRWIHVAFWVAWVIAFLVCTGLFVLVLWVGISMCLEHDLKGALSMAITALLVGLGEYIIFIYPLLEKKKT